MSLGPAVDGDQMVVLGLTDVLAADDVDQYVEVGTVLPKTIPAEIVRVTMAPGSTSDYADTLLRVDVESFATTRPDAWALAARVHNGMGRLTGRVAGGQMFDAVDGQLPIWRYFSESRHRYIATYLIGVRPR